MRNVVGARSSGFVGISWTVLGRDLPLREASSPEAPEAKPALCLTVKLAFSLVFKLLLVQNLPRRPWDFVVGCVLAFGGKIDQLVD